MHLLGHLHFHLTLLTDKYISCSISSIPGSEPLYMQAVELEDAWRFASNKGRSLTWERKCLRRDSFCRPTSIWPASGLVAPKRKPFEAQLLICSTSDLGRSSSTFQRSAIQSWIALTKLICTELWTMWSEDTCLIRYESPPGLEHPHNKLVQHLFSELARISFKSGMNCILSANMVMLYESFGILCNILFYILEPKSSCIFWFARQQVNAAFLSIRQSYIQACMLMPFLACSCCC